MTKKLALIVNTTECVGCCACEVACKQEHDLPVGPKWIEVTQDKPKEIAGKMQLRYIVRHCLHCSHPPCLEVCPVAAISRRSDGIVLIDEEKCIGCKKCLAACPLGVMCFSEEKEVAQHCNFCVERIDRGLKPACVSACPSHCIYFGDITEIATDLKKSKLSNWL